LSVDDAIDKAHHLLNKAQQEAEYELEATIDTTLRVHVGELGRGVNMCITHVRSEIWAMANALISFFV
jgi:hypothetical protein